MTTIIEQTEKELKAVIDEYLDINIQIKKLKKHQKELIHKYNKLNKKMGQLVKNRELDAQ